MGRRKKAKAAEAAAVVAASGAAPLDRGQLADCLSQTSKIAAECNSILRDLLRGRWEHHTWLAAPVGWLFPQRVSCSQRDICSTTGLASACLHALRDALGGPSVARWRAAC